MKDEIIVNGVRYIRADEEKTEERPLTGYERAKNGGSYWSDSDGSVYANKDSNNVVDNNCYNGAYYYTAETIAKNNSRADRLMRRLRQWQALNDEPVDWSDEDSKWVIYHYYKDGELYSVDSCTTRDLGVIYFSTQEKAEEAIEVFRDELEWYFTEYQSRLDEPRRKGT